MFHHNSRFGAGAREPWNSRAAANAADSGGSAAQASRLCRLAAGACLFLARGAAGAALLVLLILLMVYAPRFARRLAGLPVGEARLSGAIAADDLEQVRRALAEGACPNGRPDYRPLVIACHGDSRAIVLALIDAGADVNAAHAGLTPLVAAAGRGRSDLVELLLRAGADPDARAEGGRTALYVAALRGHQHIVEQLHEAQRDDRTVKRGPGSRAGSGACRSTAATGANSVRTPQTSTTPGLLRTTVMAAAARNPVLSL